MRVEKRIKEELSFVSTVETLVKAYEEIAVVKMQRIRSTVLSAREFLELLNEVFLDVKTSYAQEIEKIEKKKEESKPAGKKRAGVFLSANSKFYGDIINRVFRLFISDYQKNYDEMIIMGKVGRELVESQNKSIQYRYIDYDEDNISKDVILSLMHELKDFDIVEIYYGKFENVVTQEPTMTVVSGEEVEVADDGSEKVSFYFEPSLAQILAYFESQVISAFLLQSIHESDLAKLASRTKAMEQAHQRIEDRQKALVSDSFRAKRISDDRKQQERLAGMYIWKA